MFYRRKRQIRYSCCCCCCRRFRFTIMIPFFSIPLFVGTDRRFYCGNCRPPGQCRFSRSSLLFLQLPSPFWRSDFAIFIKLPSIGLRRGFLVCKQVHFKFRIANFIGKNIVLVHSQFHTAISITTGTPRVFSLGYFAGCSSFAFILFIIKLFI